MKEVIEGCKFLTGAQSRMLMFDLKENCCNPEASLSIKTFPETLSVANRECTIEVKTAEDLSHMLDTARAVMKDELHRRALINRPSNSRLVQIVMSKQPGFDPKTILTVAQFNLAETLCKQMLRDATKLSRKTAVKTPTKKMKVETAAPGHTLLFSGAKNLPSPPTEETEPAAAAADTDQVQVEIERFKFLSPEELKPFETSDGMLNHFKMMWPTMWQLRHRFPLHFEVFKQVSAHVSATATMLLPCRNGKV